MSSSPNFTSKTLAITGCILFSLFLGICAYLVSTLKDTIRDDDFSISQALVYGEKISMIILLVSSLIVMSYLIFYRGHKYIYFRILLNIIICALMITIMWVTVFYNSTIHYIIAGIIFIILCIGILLDNYLIYNSLKKSYKLYNLINTKNLIYILITIALFIGIIVVILNYFININNSLKLRMFYAFELYMVVVKLLSIITLGFV